MDPIDKKIIKARVSLITSQPFWGTLALRLRMRRMDDAMRAHLESRGMTPRLAVDGKSIFYAPEFVEKLTGEQLQTALAHEVSHCVFDHMARVGGRNPNKWNRAADYATNPILVNSGMAALDDIEGGWLYDPQFFGMGADQIYRMLPDEPEGDGGGGGSGNKQPLCDIILSGDPQEAKQQVDEWKLATAQAAATAQQAGKLPADLKRFVDELLNPRTDWRTQLRRFLTETAKDDYSWARPNRKMLGAHGIYMPSLYSEKMGGLVVAIDTSGSIRQEDLNIFASEINGIRTSVNPESITVIYCDARINKVVVFDAHMGLELEMVGGGGTSFIPPFDYVEEQGINPVAFLYMTDGYGSAPSHPPEYPVMWCMTTNVEMPWGERIQLDMES